MNNRTWSVLAGALLLATAACNSGGEDGLPSDALSGGGSAPSSAAGATPDPGAQEASSYRKQWVVSAGGDDAADGSAGAPLRTISRAISLAEPGDLITVKAGTYAEQIEIGAGARDGTADAKITIRGEGKAKIVPGSALWAMIEVRRRGWVLDHLEIDAQKQNRAAVIFHGDTAGSVLSNSEIHNGAAGAAVTTSAGARDVLIEGNHIHHYSRGSNDSHGVVVDTRSKNIAIRNNKIHHVSGDSVQCLGPEGFNNDPPATDVLIEGNDFHSNQENAVDIKTCHRVTLRQNKMHDFLDNSGGTVVVVHMSARDVTIEDNDIFNGGKGVALGGNHDGPVPANVVIRNNRIRNMRTQNGQDGAAIRVENSQSGQIEGNTLSEIQGPALIVGHGTGGATRDLTVENNLFEAATAYNLGSMAPGFTSRRNTFLPGVGFIHAKAPLDLPGWQQLGHDADATLAR